MSVLIVLFLRTPRPKPPSLEKAPARLRALDADSYGSAPSLCTKGTAHPSRANKSLKNMATALDLMHNTFRYR